MSTVSTVDWVARQPTKQGRKQMGIRFAEVAFHLVPYNGDNTHEVAELVDGVATVPRLGDDLVIKAANGEISIMPGGWVARYANGKVRCCAGSELSQLLDEKL